VLSKTQFGSVASLSIRTFYLIARAINKTFNNITPAYLPASHSSFNLCKPFPNRLLVGFDLFDVALPFFQSLGGF
jgi:hypothetical protein